MLTSKGASGVTGAGFITLAATLQSVPGIPMESLAILVGIDRFMSECRALTNLVGNGVATVVISRWENELTAETLNANLCHPFHIELPESEEAHATANFRAQPQRRSRFRWNVGCVRSQGEIVRQTAAESIDDSIFSAKTPFASTFSGIPWFWQRLQIEVISAINRRARAEKWAERS